jgi:hypothetical protein
LAVTLREDKGVQISGKRVLRKIWDIGESNRRLENVQFGERRNICSSQKKNSA